MVTTGADSAVYVAATVTCSGRSSIKGTPVYSSTTNVSTGSVLFPFLTFFTIKVQSVTKSASMYWQTARYSSHNRPLQPKKETVLMKVSPPKSELIRVDAINERASMIMPGKP